MTNIKINRHYYLEEKTKIIWHTKILYNDIGFTYMGTSDNPRPKMAAAAFIQQGKALTGCKIKEYFKD